MKIIERRFLPTKTNSVHAASIAFFCGHPVFSWFGGSREGAGDVRTFIHNLNKDSQTIAIGAEDNIPRWNPVLFAIKDRLLLFEKMGMFCDRWQTLIHDITLWSNDIPEKEIRDASKFLPAGLNGPVKTKPLIDNAGRDSNNDEFICGSSVETFYDWSSYIEKYSFMGNKVTFISRSDPITLKDKKTYSSVAGTRETLGIIQPSLWRSLENHKDINAFFRSSSGLGKIYVSYSRFGKWSEPIATNLENPNSGIDTLVYKNKLYLVSNPSQTARQPLTIKQLSKDNGNSSVFNTDKELTIREKVEEENPLFTRELSYPYMVENEGLFHLVYTYGRTKIEYVVIDPKDE